MMFLSAIVLVLTSSTILLGGTDSDVNAKSKLESNRKYFECRVWELDFEHKVGPFPLVRVAESRRFYPEQSRIQQVVFKDELYSFEIDRNDLSWSERKGLISKFFLSGRVIVANYYYHLFRFFGQTLVFSDSPTIFIRHVLLYSDPDDWRYYNRVAVLPTDDSHFFFEGVFKNYSKPELAVTTWGHPLNLSLQSLLKIKTGLPRRYIFVGFAQDPLGMWSREFSIFFSASIQQESSLIVEPGKYPGWRTLIFGRGESSVVHEHRYQTHAYMLGEGPIRGLDSISITVDSDDRIVRMTQFPNDDPPRQGEYTYSGDLITSSVVYRNLSEGRIPVKGYLYNYIVPNGMTVSPEYLKWVSRHAQGNRLEGPVHFD